MNVFRTVWVVAVILLSAQAHGADGPRIFSADPAALSQIKQRLAKADAALAPAYEGLLRDADKALKSKPTSVMDKPKVAHSGDKHDYASFAPYFWPDPKTADGLPYIRKDGQRNRELQAGGDSPAFEKLLGETNTLALAFYFSGREAYAEHAAALLRTWFLDPATKMNPNFTHAQAIPGVTDGRGIGLIEFRGMYLLVDALGFLEASKSWTEQDRTAMRQWLADYWQWLQTHKNAKDERAAKNNHGMWFDVQETALALYLGKGDEARGICEQFKTQRIAAQIRPDGQMPLETERADGWGYTLFNLNAMTIMACLGQRVGVDLWQYQGPDGQSIRKAVDFVVPYLNPDKKWPFKPVKELTGDRLIVPLHYAERAYGPDTYKAAIERISADKRSSSYSVLGYPR